METNFKHVPELNTFVLAKNGSSSFINYQIRNNIYILWHSEVPPELRGQGIGKELVEKTFEYLVENNLKARATCSYIASIAKRNNKWHNNVQY